MPILADSMPPLLIDNEFLQKWGETWSIDQNIDAFVRKQSINFASSLDRIFAVTLAVMLGNIPVLSAVGNSIIPPIPDCVELGNARIVGGIKPQNVDVAYCPDGPKVVFDSKTLNDSDSVRKNWQNMINDLVTESATVHTRYPYAVVAFMVVIPEPTLAERQEMDIILSELSDDIVKLLSEYCKHSEEQCVDVAIETSISAERKYLLLNFTRNKDEDRKENFIIVINDITESRRLEEESKRKEKLSAMGELASGVARMR